MWALRNRQGEAARTSTDAQSVQVGRGPRPGEKIAQQPQRRQSGPQMGLCCSIFRCPGLSEVRRRVETRLVCSPDAEVALRPIKYRRALGNSQLECVPNTLKCAAPRRLNHVFQNSMEKVTDRYNLASQMCLNQAIDGLSFCNFVILLLDTAR